MATFSGREPLMVRWPLMAGDHWLKKTLDRRQPSMDNFWWKTTVNGRPSLIFNGRWPSKKDSLWREKTELPKVEFDTKEHILLPMVHISQWYNKFSLISTWTQNNPKHPVKVPGPANLPQTTQAIKKLSKDCLLAVGCFGGVRKIQKFDFV